MFTPFYFIKAGIYVSLPALWSGAAIIGALLLLKMLSKIGGYFVPTFGLLNHAGAFHGDQAAHHHLVQNWQKGTYLLRIIHDFDHHR